MQKYDTVDAYFESLSGESLEKMLEMRSLLKEVLRECTEVISYGMPAFKNYGMVVFYAPAKNHLGFYPTNTGVAHFNDELKPYKTSKGAIQLPLNAPLPKNLIQKIALFKKEEDEAKYMAKKKPKS